MPNAMVSTAPSQLERDVYCLRVAGFAVIRGAVTAERVEAISADVVAFEEEVARYIETGGTAPMRHSWPLQTTRCLFAVSTGVQDIAMDEYVQSVASTYLCRPILRDCVLQTVMPDSRNVRRGPDADVSFHRDLMWPAESIEPMYLHALLLLDDCTRANGSTVVVPGTHREREPGYYFKKSDPRAPQPGIDYRVYERRYFPSAVDVEACRGSLVFLDPMVIHSQGNNTTAVPRRVINILFRSGAIEGQPRLLNSRRIAERYARVPVRPDLLEMLESDERLPAYFGPLGDAAMER